MGEFPNVESATRQQRYISEIGGKIYSLCTFCKAEEESRPCYLVMFSDHCRLLIIANGHRGLCARYLRGCWGMTFILVAVLFDWGRSGLKNQQEYFFSWFIKWETQVSGIFWIVLSGYSQVLSLVRNSRNFAQQIIDLSEVMQLIQSRKKGRDRNFVRSDCLSKLGKSRISASNPCFASLIMAIAEHFYDGTLWLLFSLKKAIDREARYCYVL